MIYFDNSATTLRKPKCVSNTLRKYLKHWTANPGRSGHSKSIEIGSKVYETREKVADFVNCEPSKVIFTSGCTEALNLAILGTRKKGGHIITTTFEHNSVLRTLEYAKENYNINFSVLKPTRKDMVLKISEFDSALTPETYAVIVNHTSNVLGCTQDIKKIGKWCKDNNLLFIVDSAQSLGHEIIDMKSYGINLLAWAGHKGLYGLQGVGGLCLNGNFPLLPIKFGGTGTSSMDLKQPTSIPEGFESGTLPTPAIMSIYASIDFVKSNYHKIHKKIVDLTQFLYENLSKIPNVEIFTPPNCNSGIISFNIKDRDSAEISNILNEEYNIATRDGLHCAPFAHNYLGTVQTGTVRISLSYFNKKSEIKKLLKAVNKIATFPICEVSD